MRVAAARSPLPAETTTFVGRKAELETAKRIVSGCRLLTLTGPSGVGTSRLAVQLAEQLAPRMPEVAYADLSQDDAVPALASGLIVIDNADRRDDARAIVAQILEDADDVVVIVAGTSMLGIDGEHTLPVLPFDIPQRIGASARVTAESDAIRLFLDRAKPVNPVIAQLTTQQLIVVRDICAACDGLPAMIEIAAAATRLLPLEELREALRGGTVVDALPAADRYVARAAAVVDGLDGAEREVVAIGSALRESFGLDCVASLAGGGQEHVRAFARLVDRSVLIAEPSTPGTFRIPRMVRRLADAAFARTPDDYADRIEQHVKAVLDELSQIPYGNSEAQLTRHLQHHRRTIERIFTRYAGDPDSSGELIRLIMRLRRYWGALGLRSKVDEWLEEAIRCRKRRGELAAAAMRTEAYFAAMIGDFERSSELLAESVAVAGGKAPALDDLPPEFVEALIRMGERDVDVAETLLQKVVDDTRSEGRHDALEEQLHYLALVSVIRGDYERAEQRLRSNVEWLRSRGNRWGIGYALILLSITLLHRGLNERAAETAREALMMMDSLGDRAGVPTALRLIAALAFRRGDAARAATLLAAASRMDPQRTIAAEQALGGVEAGLRRALGPREYSRLSSRGRHLDRSELVAFALGEDTTRHSATQLTRRETEIAALLVDGLSSAQIAATLVLSTRTVEGHIQRMLNKLEFRSRSQIAVWMSDRLDSTGGARITA